MTSKKPNSGGKKFQNRMPEEKRVRVKPKADEKPFRGKRDGKFGEKKFEDRPKKSFPNKGFSDDKPPRKFNDRGTSSGFERGGPRLKKDGTPYAKRESSRDRGADFGREKKPGFAKRETGTDRKTYPKTERSDRGDFKRSGAGSGNTRPGGFNKRSAPKAEGRYGTGADRNERPRPEKNYKSKFADKRGDKAERSGRTFHKKGDKPQNFKGGRKKYNETSENLVTGKLLTEDEVRLNRYIANSGMCSRREADVMIAQGLVTINGVVVETLGTKVHKNDDVRVDGKRINPEKPVYILLNKPKGYITSTSDPNERATVMDLIDLPGKERIYPVGRLDRNTTGVLLLTNDGELAQKLMHPSFEIKKIYKAGLDRKPNKDHMLAWVNGVELEDGFMSFEQIGFVDEEDDTVLGLEVHSGRNRIVRRMFEHFEYTVKSLDRVMLGEFDHLKLGRGKWRFLNEKEIQYVERLKRMKGKRR